MGWKETGVVDGGRKVVVDAANVVGSRPDGWWRDRVGAARRLLGRLAVLQEQLVETDLIVVLEGAACRAVSGVDAPDTGRVRVVLAPGSGDDTIVRVTAEVAQDSAVTVVTADRGLRQRIEATGAVATGPRWLLDQLDELPQQPHS
ncbi:NYN domain-containing protein [Kribbella sp. NPDC054772]